MVQTVVVVAVARKCECVPLSREEHDDACEADKKKNTRNKTVEKNAPRRGTVRRWWRAGGDAPPLTQVGMKTHAHTLTRTYMCAT